MVVKGAIFGHLLVTLAVAHANSMGDLSCNRPTLPQLMQTLLCWIHLASSSLPPVIYHVLLSHGHQSVTFPFQGPLVSSAEIFVMSPGRL
jgi:hypothetical protein